MDHNRAHPSPVYFAETHATRLMAKSIASATPVARLGDLVTCDTPSANPPELVGRLPESARFSTLQKLPEGEDLGKAVNAAMRAIEAENEERLRDFADWQVDGEMMRAAKPDALFMHCLPAHRGEEVEAALIDGPQSVVWEEAENRLHAQKALIEYLLLGQSPSAWRPEDSLLVVYAMWIDLQGLEARTEQRRGRLAARDFATAAPYIVLSAAAVIPRLASAMSM